MWLSIILEATVGIFKQEIQIPLRIFRDGTWESVFSGFASTGDSDMQSVLE